MPIDAEKAIKKLEAKGLDLPPQPGILIELREKLDSDNWQINDLTRIISGDPDLTAMLFKLAGSLAYGINRKLVTLEAVLMEIGIKQTCNLVKAISLSSSISGALDKSFGIFWIRAQELAQVAAVIAADRISICNIFPDQAYLAGIFHECGVPVLMQRFPDYSSKLHLDSTTGWPSLADEDLLFKVDHCSIGYLMAKHWNLPDFVCQAVLHHHKIPHEAPGAVRTLVAILQLAIQIYHLINRAGQQGWAEIREQALSELGIHPDEERAYCEKIAGHFLA